MFASCLAVYYVPVYPNQYVWSDFAVRNQMNRIKISPLCFFRIFKSQFVSEVIITADLLQFELNIGSFIGSSFYDFKRVFAFWKYGHYRFLSCAYNTCKSNMPRFDDCKIFDKSGEFKIEPILFRVVCFDNDCFRKFSAAVTCCIALYINGSLTTGRDLFRVRNSRTASAGFNTLNQEMA